MLSGLLEKTLREMGVVVLLTAAGLAAAMGLFVQILPQFEASLNDIVLQVPFIRTLISGLIGMDVSSGLAPEMLLVVVWSHPIVLAILWGFAVAHGTRLPAAEIERGTIDVLLGWPVSRRAVYASEALVALAAGVVILAGGFLGFEASASTLAADIRPDPRNALYALGNLYALQVFVAGAVQCVSAGCDRRGRAMGLAVAFLLTSYLIGFLSTLWEPARRIAFASFVHYYRPAQVMLTGRVPVRDVLVLLVAGALLWGLGGLVWSRRDVLTT